MESQCDYSMYFPAVPLPPRAELAGDPGRYRALPRRNHLYLGETVRFLLVLRCRGAGAGAGAGADLGARGAWSELASALAALASVSAGGGMPGAGGSTGEPDPEPPGGGDPGGGALFRGCSPLLTHGPGPATSGGASTVRSLGRGFSGVIPRLQKGLLGLREDEPVSPQIAGWGGSSLREDDLMAGLLRLYEGS